MSTARPIRIVGWPPIVLLGLCALLLALNLVALAFPPDVTRGQAKPIETVTREIRQIEGRSVECARTEDHLNHTTSLSC